MGVTTMTSGTKKMPLGLLAFCYGLMGPACAINGVFIALAIPEIAPFGFSGLAVAGGIGAVVGIAPALWLAIRIRDGISEGS